MHTLTLDSMGSLTGYFYSTKLTLKFISLQNTIKLAQFSRIKLHEQWKLNATDL